MEQEKQGTEVPEQTKALEVAQLSKEQPSDLKKIAVDIAPGVSVELDVETAKKVIQHRDSRTKGFKELEAKLKSAEDAAKNEASRAQLLEAMKAQNLEAVEEQVSSKYKETISKFQAKVFNGEIKSTLSKLGILPDALEDSAKLVMSDAKIELDGDDVKINGVKADEYLATWTKNKAHLMAVKTQDSKGKIVTRGGKPPEQKPNGPDRLAKGLGSFFKQQ